MPDVFNPQSLNRFSYVHNHPLRYTDPTGHMLDDGRRDYGCGGPPNVGGGGVRPSPQSDREPTTSPIPTPSPLPVPLPIPILTLPILPLPTIISTGTPPASFALSSYCGGGLNGLYNFFDCGANVTQDLALLIDTPFAGLEVVLITAGCFAGPEGCLAGAGVAHTIFNVTGANLDETALSLASAGFSALADFTDDGHLSGSTGISAIAAVAGLFSPDPILDFAIDGFGSAYNHEVRPIFDLPSRINSLFRH